MSGLFGLNELFDTTSVISAIGSFLNNGILLSIYLAHMDVWCFLFPFDDFVRLAVVVYIHKERV